MDFSSCARSSSLFSFSAIVILGGLREHGATGRLLPNFACLEAVDFRVPFSDQIFPCVPY